jgi:probable HAF family extracellular repeat protein
MLPARLALVAALFFASPAGASPMFVPLPSVPGAGAFASGVSGDGSVVVGFTIDATTTEAFRWTSEDGMVGLGDLAGGSFQSSASAASSDGSVIVGQGRSASGLEAFRWTSEDGMVGLGDLAGGSFNSTANAVSADGSVIVGYGNFGASTEAFRWTSSGGMVGLGDLDGGRFSSIAHGVSADGSVVVGGGNSAAGPDGEAFLWTSEDGMVGLGDLAGGIFLSSASGVSADGSVVVGQGSGASGFEAFRWTSSGGMVGLGDLALLSEEEGEIFSSFAVAVSADGSVVVGSATILERRAAFIWDPINGMRDLRAVLMNDYGLDLAGWWLDEATGISADGKTIVGNANGRVWLAVLPEPSAALLWGLGLAGLAAAGRLHR